MNRFVRKLLKLWYQYSGNDEGFISLKVQQFCEQGGICGSNFKFYCDMPVEPYLVTIGDEVTISAGTVLLTHDNSIIKCDINATDYFGKIVIGDYCFIGMHSVVLPGVTLGAHTIVGAGSVVTKSFPNGGVVLAGNPAHVVCTIDDFREKKRTLAVNLDIDDRRRHKREFIMSLPEEMFERK